MSIYDSIGILVTVSDFGIFEHWLTNNSIRLGTEQTNSEFPTLWSMDDVLNQNYASTNVYVWIQGFTSESTILA